ncbi:MAG: hypothetical protein F4X34_08340 [Chloroflexi bacterium]|nr:hypothetical protein [Chloroflexota bacterium]
MVTVNPIRTEEDYQAALARVDEIFQAKLGTPEGDELDVLTDLIVVYEDKHYPIGSPSLIQVLEHQLEESEMTEEDLIPLIGSRQKVADVLAGKLDITMPMARALHKRLGIPAESLLQEPPALR